jgi:hypothetical protein
MERRHEELLTARLEEAMLNGYARFTWSELRHWYEKDKLAAGTYRDMARRWREITNKKTGPLMMVRSGSDALIVFDGHQVLPIDSDDAK